jgi:hypothetical protein
MRNVSKSNERRNSMKEKWREARETKIMMRVGTEIEVEIEVIIEVVTEGAEDMVKMMKNQNLLQEKGVLLLLLRYH